MADSEIPRITSSGLLQIDTALIRERIPDLLRVRSQLDDVRGKIANCATQLSASPFSTERLHRMLSLSEQTDVLVSQTTHSLEQLAIAYEMLEVRNKIEILMRAGNYPEAISLSKHLISLREANPDAAAVNVSVPRHQITFNPADMKQTVFMVIAIFARWLGAGYGVIRKGNAAVGELPDMQALLVSSEVITSATAISKAMPHNLQEVARSIPAGKDSQIRVTRIVNNDGTEQFVVDIAGTQDSFGSGDFSMADNLPLYLGEPSKTLAAVYAALEAAGAAPGDSIHLVGHSQGAMVSSQIAAAGRYNTLSVTTFGAPVSAELPANIDVAEFGHSDDVIHRLAGPGHSHALGSNMSFRYTDTVFEGEGPSIKAHEMSRYIESAAEADKTNDPRVEHYNSERQKMFADAAKIHITEYTAKEMK